jgi:hypothetical protein
MTGPVHRACGGQVMFCQVYAGYCLRCGAEHLTSGDYGQQAPEGAPPSGNWGLVVDVFDVLEAHGYRRGDDQTVGRAVGLVIELVAAYTGGGTS